MKELGNESAFCDWVLNKERAYYVVTFGTGPGDTVRFTTLREARACACRHRRHATKNNLAVLPARIGRSKLYEPIEWIDKAKEQ